MDEKKLEYIDSLAIKGTNEIAFFRKAEDNEKVLSKDLSEWNAKEIIDFYKSLCSPSLDFIYNIHIVYKKYTNWCLYKNLLTDNINHYDEITMDILMQCVNKSIADQRIISRENVLKELSRLENPRDQFICLACFEGLIGIGFKDMIDVRLSDFDLKSHIVHINGKVIPFTDKLYQYAKQAAETQVYTNSNSGNPNRQYIMVGDPDQIIKKVVSRENSDPIIKPQVIYDAIKSVQDRTGNPALTSKALKESGRIDMIKNIRKENPSLSLTEALKQTLAIYGNLVSLQSYINKYNDFLK